MAEYGKDERLRLMRAANTKANYKYGMGGLPKGEGHKPRPITLPKMPWDEEKPDGATPNSPADRKTEA